MRRPVLSALLALAAAGWLPGSNPHAWAQEPSGLRDLPEIRAAGSLRVGADPTSGSPYIFHPANSQSWEGFEADLARTLAQRLKVSVSFVEVPWRELHQAVVEGKVDVACNALEIKATTGIQFSKPYYVASQAIVAHKNTPGIYGIKDLAKRRVAVTTGSVAAAIVSRIAPPALLIPHTDTSAPLRTLLAKKADAAVLESAMANAWLKSHSKEFQVVGRPLLPNAYGIAVRGSSRALQQALDEALLAVKRSGEHERLLKKHHVWDVLQKGGKPIVPAVGPLPSLPPQ